MHEVSIDGYGASPKAELNLIGSEIAVDHYLITVHYLWENSKIPDYVGGRCVILINTKSPRSPFEQQITTESSNSG